MNKIASDRLLKYGIVYNYIYVNKIKNIAYNVKKVPLRYFSFNYFGRQAIDNILPYQALLYAFGL
jgi:hypothetical protein